MKKLVTHFKDKSIVLMSILVLISQDTFIFGVREGGVSMFPLYVYLLLLLYFVYCYSASKQSQFQDKPFLYTIILTICIILSGIANDDLSLGYFLKASLFFVGLFYALIVPFESFKSSFVNVIYFISIFSLLSYLINLIAPEVLSIFPAIPNTKGYLFRYLFLSVIPIDASLIRLYGPFREPGVYQIFLNLAFLFHIVSKQSLDYKKILVFGISIILTLSTTGYIGFVFILCLLLFKRNESSQKASVILTIIILFVPVVFFSDIADLNGVVFGKLTDSDRGSTVSRVASVFTNIKIFQTSPIFGVGFTKLPQLFVNINMNEYGFLVEDNANTIFPQFALHGFLYGFLWIFGLILFSKKIAGGELPYIGVIIAILIISFGENLTWNILYYILIEIGFTYNRRAYGR